MPAKITYRRPNRGMSLIEIMLATLLLMIVVIGTSGYRYYSTLDVRKASKHETASRIASLLNEGWRGLHGAVDPNYPVISLSGTGLDIQEDPSGTGPDEPDEYILLNGKKYKVVSDNATFFVTISYKIAETDNDNTFVLHERVILNIQVAWPITSHETSYSVHPDNYRLFTLTTYVENIIY